MDVVQHLLVLVHLVAFAALLGGSLVQLRTPEPEVNAAMLHGAWASLATGVALWVLSGVVGPDVSTGAMVVKTVVGVVLTVLAVLNRRFFSIPRGLLLLVTVLALAEAAVAVLW